MVVLKHFYNDRIWTRLPLLAVMALIAGILTNGQAWAHDDELEVTGFYDTIFTQFNPIGPGVASVELQGPFELTIGGVVRTVPLAVTPRIDCRRWR